MQSLCVDLKGLLSVVSPAVIFEAAHLLNCLAMDDKWFRTVWGVWCPNDQLVCFVHVWLQVVISAPLFEEGHRGLLGCNRVIVIE